MSRSSTITCLLLILSAFLLPPVFAGRRPPFEGYWVSKQYSNGREFDLRIKQEDGELSGWEGKLPPGPPPPVPDFEGSVKGKSAFLEIEHRRGYKGHASLTLQGDKLVWHLLDADSRSSRYFPLASTLCRRDEEIPSDQPLNPKDLTLQPLWDLLAKSHSYENALIGFGAQPSPFYRAYRSLIARGVKSGDPALNSLLKSGSPSGKVYGACILWETDRAAARKVFDSLLSDRSGLRYTSGCCISETTVADVARSFLDKGGYEDFDKNPI